jgi:hypothetical protein
MLQEYNLIMKHIKSKDFFFQLWIILVDICQTFKKNSNSADLCHLYVLGAKLHQHLHHCHPLQANYVWPYVIESRLNDLNYIVNTLTRRKNRHKCELTA